MSYLPALSDALALLIPAALVGWTAAWCGRKLGLPGFVLPVVAGILLGPGVLGRIAPDLHEYLLRGGAAERRELAERQSHYDAQVQSLTATGVTEDAVIEYQDRIDGELEPYRQAVVDAQARRSETERLLVWSAVGLTLMGLGARVRAGRLFALMREAMPLAMCMIVLTAVLAAAGATLLGRMQPGAGANLWFAGLMLGCMSAAVPVSRRLMDAMRHAKEQRALEDRPQLLEAAGVIVMLTMWVVFTLVRPTNMEATYADVMGVHVTDALSAGAMILVAMFVVHPWLSGRRKCAGDVLPAAVGLAVAGVGYYVLGLHPALVAWVIGLTLGASVLQRLVDLAGPVAMVMIGWQMDVVGDMDVWLVLVALIVFGDGKGLGMLLGVRWFAGRSWMEAIGMGAAAGAGGMLPVVFAFVLYEANVIDRPLLAAMVAANVICGAMARAMLKWVSAGP